MSNRSALKPINTGKTMFLAPSTEIRSILKQIDDKGVRKEDRINAINELRKILCSVSSLNDIRIDWNEVATPLRSVITHKTMSGEIRRSCAQALSAFGSLTAVPSFLPFVNLIRDCWNGVGKNGEDRRVLIVEAFTGAIILCSERDITISDQDMREACSMFQSIIDENGSMAVHSPLMELSQVLYQYSPHVFLHIFPDVVDVAVGWLIEEGKDGISAAKLEKTKEILQSFGPLWFQMIHLIEKLSKQFIQDIHNDLDDAKENADIDSFLRVKAIAGTLNIFINICGQLRSPKAANIVRFVSQEMINILSKNDLVYYVHCEKISSMYAVYIDVLTGCVPFQFDEVNMDLVSRLISIARKNIGSSSILIALFNFLSKISLENKESIGVPMCNAIFGGSSPLIESIPFSCISCNAITSLCSLLKSLLNPSLISLLQLSYSSLLSIIKVSLSRLLEKNKISQMERSDNEIRIGVIIFSLRPILILKNSLIVMLGLNPSLFDVLLVESDILSTRLQYLYPTLHYTLLQAAYDHCKAHDNFIATSDWLTCTSSSVVLGESLSCHHLQRIVSTLSTLISSHHLISIQSRSIIVEWLIDLKDVLVRSIQSEYAHTTIRHLLHSIRICQSISPELSSRLSSLIISLEESFGEEAMRSEDGLQLRRSIDDSHNEDRSIILFNHLSTYTLIQSYGDELNNKGIVNVYDTPLLIPSSSHIFELITNFILKRIPPIESANAENEDKKEEWLYSPSSSSSSLSLYWKRRLLSAAAYAIESKMNTHLGKAKDTLNAFQSELNRLAKMAVTQKDYDDDNVLSRREEWFRIRCLLEFIEILDRLIFIAHSGSISPVYTPSATSRTWFKMNESVCVEWFNRLYPSAMGVAFHTSAYSQVLRFGYAAIADVERKRIMKPTYDTQVNRLMMTILGWLLRALVEKGEGSSIEGIRKWSEKIWIESKWEWIKPIEDAANGRLEEALDGIQSHLIENKVPDDAKSTVQDIMMSCVIKLRDSSRLNRDIIDNDSYERCVQLTTFGKVDRVKEGGSPLWDLNDALLNRETWLMSTVKKSEVLSCRNELSAEGAIVVLLDDDGILAGRYCALSSIASNVNLRMNKAIQWKGIQGSTSLISSVCNGSIDRIEALSLCRQSNGWNLRLGSSQSNQKEHFDMARLARQTRNGHTMNAHLDLCYGKEVNSLLNIQLEKTKYISLLSDKKDVFESSKIELISILTNAYHILSMLKVEESMGNREAAVESLPLANSISRTSLKLAKWMSDGDKIGETPMTKLHFDLETRRAETGLDEIGVLIHLSATLSPNLAKTHYVLGQHILSVAESEQVAQSFKTLLGMEIGPDDANEIVEAMRKSMSIVSLESRIKEALGRDVMSIESQIGSDGLIPSLWAQLQQRKMILFSSSIGAFFAFLIECGRSGEVSSVEVVSSTLQILHILVIYSHMHGLESQIDDGFNGTDVKVWRDILPQLFSRLSHPVKSVRAVIVRLLARIGSASPHSIVYQVVVGGRSREVLSDDVFDMENDEGRTNTHSKERSSVYECCRALELSLMEHSPSLLQDVRMFVDELHRLNMTDERWCFVLHHLDMDMSRRLNHIRREKDKTLSLNHLSIHMKEKMIKEKTSLIIGPVYRILRDFWSKTKIQAEKGVEDAKRFVSLFEEDIDRAFEMSEEANERGDEDGRWEAFVRLSVTVVRRTNRKGGNIMDISHCLTQLIDKRGQWNVPLPGQDDVPYNEIISLQSVDSQALVLSTKTRPKKLTLRGNDGKDRTFLFKGHEDLHLDERIMQLLHMCNLMLQAQSKKESPSYETRYYAVTPLGPLSGLIQWVHGACPLYTFYRKWQQREVAKVPPGKTPPDGINLRPLELYDKRLKELFQANKCDQKVIGDRRQWPSDLLRTLFDDLVKETPRDLITREMWLRSSSAAKWQQSIWNFSRSTAVMSMIGSILGLGDRHPDNLLIDMNDFRVIHIDYNVCFDKGKKLRVPETVPFRLTQNIQEGCGLTNVYGFFTSSCIRVLSSLRKHSKLFSSLLQAFVYDPLVDWNQKDNLGSSVAYTITHIVYGNDGRAEVMRPVAKSLFVIKMQEMEEILRILSLEAVSFLGRLLNGNEKNGLNGNDPLARWSTVVDEMCSILRKDDEYTDFLREDRKIVLKTRETLAWNGITHEMSTTFINTLIGMVPDMSNKLTLLAEKIESTISNKENLDSAKDIGLPPGLEEFIASKQEENTVAALIAQKIVRRVEGKIGSIDDETIYSPEYQANRLITSSMSRTNLSLMYEGWIGWV